MAERVRLVVTCTKRKTQSAPEALRLRSVNTDTLEARAKKWMERLAEAADPCVPAEDLYCGDHWSVVRSTPKVSETPVQLWICSAGYGLIRADEKIASYSATFSVGHPDSVHRGGAGSARETYQRWWALLAEWGGPTEAIPRTLRDVVREDPSTPLLVVGSTTYLQAMQQDLQGAAAELADPTLLSILSAGTDQLPGLTDHLLPYDARLRRVLGGGMMSLNVRVAREILRQGWTLRAPELATSLQAVAQNLEPIVSPVRTPQDDEAVRAFLREELHRDPSQRCNPLLRKLRDERNWACEQKRFRALYHEVQSSDLTLFES